MQKFTVAQVRGLARTSEEADDMATLMALAHRNHPAGIARKGPCACGADVQGGRACRALSALLLAWSAERREERATSAPRGEDTGPYDDDGCAGPREDRRTAHRCGCGYEHA